MQSSATTVDAFLAEQTEAVRRDMARLRAMIRAELLREVVAKDITC